MTGIFTFLKGVLPEAVIVILVITYFIINKLNTTKFHKIVNVYMKIFEIRFIQTLKEQMEYVEGKIGVIREKNEIVMKEMLKVKGYPEHEIDEFYVFKSFMITIEFIIEQTKNDLRRDFKDIAKSDTLNNPNITDYEEIGYLYEQYYEPRIDSYMKFAHKKMREDWIDNDFLSRDEMRAELVKGEEQNKMFVRDLYVHAMRIMIAKNKRIKELEKEVK